MGIQRAMSSSRGAEWAAHGPLVASMSRPLMAAHGPLVACSWWPADMARWWPAVAGGLLMAPCRHGAIRKGSSRRR
jgi:hypothetical protein